MARARHRAAEREKVLEGIVLKCSKIDYRARGNGSGEE